MAGQPGGVGLARQLGEVDSSKLTRVMVREHKRSFVLAEHAVQAALADEQPAIAEECGIHSCGFCHAQVQ
jgi:hypothetical protein